MKKIHLVLGILTANFAQAEPINVSELSEYEKKVHRLAWCCQMGSAMLNDKVPRFNYDVSWNVYNLMDTNGFFKQDWAENKVSLKTQVI